MNLREVGEDFMRALKAVLGLPLVTRKQTRDLHREIEKESTRDREIVSNE